MTQAKVGEKAPAFDMPSTKDIKNLQDNVSSGEYLGRWVVLFFYPLDFTFVCPTELTAISDRYDEFQERNVEVIGVSTDSVYSHRAWLQTPREQNGVEGLKYPLGSDITKQVARDYGVLVEEKGIALRGMFIIDPEGILQYSVIHNLNVGRSVDEMLRVIDALQTGGLCPSDWRPGKKLINA